MNLVIWILSPAMHTYEHMQPHTNNERKSLFSFQSSSLKFNPIQFFIDKVSQAISHHTKKHRNSDSLLKFDAT